METKKRAVACLIGGIFGMLVALAVKQVLEWFWITAGMAAGAGLAYLCYDLGQVFEKAPLAWQKTFNYTSNWWFENDQEVRSWKLSPFLKFVSLISFFITVISFYLFIFYAIRPEEIEVIAAVNIETFILSFFISGFSYSMGFFTSLLCLAFAWFGITFVEKKFWFPLFIPRNPEVMAVIVDQLEKKGLRKTTPTVTLLFRWSLEGILFVPFAIFRFGVPFLLKIVMSLIRFVRVLIRLIHSEGRVTSACYSALAILISCLFWGRTAETPAESVFAIISAGIIGAAFGSISCKISQRLGLVPNK